MTDSKTPIKWYNNNKILIPSVTAFVLFMGFILNLIEDKKPEIKNTPPVEEIGPSNHIPGLMPADVHINFSNAGFSIEKKINIDGTGASLWINKKSEAGIDYEVVTYCAKGVNNVDEIRLTATRLSGDKKAIAMMPFLKFGCSIPFEGGDPIKASKFIDDNFNNDKASIIISGVKFTIYSPTEFVRMITIEKQK